MLTLRSFEPAGSVLSFSPDDLTRHVIAFGATGSGKTSAVINPMLKQAIGWHAQDPQRKAGMLVLDPKNEAAEKVLAYAREVGRADDVVVLSQAGEARFDFWGDFKRLDQVDEYSRRILYNSRELGDQNAYWTETRAGLVNSILVLLLAGGDPITFDGAVEFFRAWVYTRNSDLLQQRLKHVGRLLAGNCLTATTRRRLEQAVLDAENWKVLEDRTRELHKSVMSNALRPLLSAAARDYFDARKPVQFNPRDVVAGKILVASVDAVAHSQLAALLFKVLKRDCYSAIMGRGEVRPETGRMAGLFCDELALSITSEDAEALSVLRSKSGFVVAAAQSISGMHEVLGMRRTEALLANFNSYFFFGSRENALDEFALLAMGGTDEVRRSKTAGDFGDLQVMEQAQASQRPICPFGSLARLGQHQCYAKLASGVVTKAPVWLEPHFFDHTPVTVELPRNDLAEAVGALRSEDDDKAKLDMSVEKFCLHMHQRGHVLHLTPNVLVAAWQLCTPSMSRSRLFPRFPSTMRGLDGLPSCWLMGLAGLFEGRPGLAGMVMGIGFRSGIVWPELDAPCTWWGDGPTSVPELMNLRVYPSLWRPLKRRHMVRLYAERPDLRQEIASLPQLALPPDAF